MSQEVLLSVLDALGRLSAVFQPLPVEKLPLSKCSQRVLAEDIIADTDLPPFANSAMDGYAVYAQDVSGASREQPVKLRVMGEILASQESSVALGRGEAMRIMTGAHLPSGSDAVVPVEQTSDASEETGRSLPAYVDVMASANPGDHVRSRGQDVRAGTMVLQTGTRLRPQDIGMLAALGIAMPNVYRQPRLAIFSAGDELLEIDQPLLPGHIRDANGYALAAAATALGAIPIRLEIAPDKIEAVVDRLDLAVEEGVDLIVTSAGVSMGTYDYVRTAVETYGELTFWRVNIRPGKPLVFGKYRDVPFLGLPGNPVSALVTFEIFVRPALERLSGARKMGCLKTKAHMLHAFESDGRESYLRARITWDGDEYKARLTGSQDSGVLSSLVAANALVVVPAGVKAVNAGDILEAWILNTTSV
jgi:molybdopterin molybdotransferase